MVMTTAAAAATRMAMAAVSTVTEVAKIVISQSRRALNAPRWGGTVGIAGRETMECPPQRIRAGNAYGRLRAVGSVALLRRRGQECGHQHDEGSRQPEQLGGKKRGHGVTQGPVHEDAAEPWCGDRWSGFGVWPVPEKKITTMGCGQTAWGDGAGPLATAGIHAAPGRPI